MLKGRPASPRPDEASRAALMLAARWCHGPVPSVKYKYLGGARCGSVRNCSDRKSLDLAGRISGRLGKLSKIHSCCGHSGHSGKNPGRSGEAHGARSD